MQCKVMKVKGGFHMPTRAGRMPGEVKDLQECMAELDITKGRIQEWD